MSGELRAGGETLRVMLKGENPELRREGPESSWKRLSRTRMVRSCPRVIETEKDDAKDEAGGESKKLPDWVWEGQGAGRRRPRRSLASKWEGVQSRGGCALGTWVGSWGGHTRQFRLGIFRLSVSQPGPVGLSARQVETWAWLRSEASMGA